MHFLFGAATRKPIVSICWAGLAWVKIEYREHPISAAATRPRLTVNRRRIRQQRDSVERFDPANSPIRLADKGHDRTGAFRRDTPALLA
jgi:hypothetical protein